jgi:hypothetical protein
VRGMTLGDVADGRAMLRLGDDSEELALQIQRSTKPPPGVTPQGQQQPPSLPVNPSLRQ